MEGNQENTKTSKLLHFQSRGSCPYNTAHTGPGLPHIVSEISAFENCLCSILKQAFCAHTHIFPHSLAASFLDKCLERKLRSGGSFKGKMNGDQHC